MKILSIMTIDPSVASEPSSQEEMDRMGKLIAEMKSKGVLIDTGGRMPDMLELTVARKSGNTTITDGPFTEAKEVVGGFALLEVKDRDDAIAWTNRFLDLIGNATCHLHEVDFA
ncbi:MAG: YciI family protein [Vulcanimicrobiaceae bacterium]